MAEEKNSEEKKGKRITRKREKKEKISDIERKISILIETGKVVFGERQSLKHLLTGDPKVVIYAKNIDEEKKRTIEKLARLSNIKAIMYNGSSLQLGKLCGKLFPVGVFVALDLGEAEF
jgi:large subunit ribosomal protein L30e